ncbi:Hypothetical protein POVR1_LOCUS114 [uncultured virus]|nr:Hypothetical protein POVR1_LOCUS114 [uncultured virus]
MAEKVKIYSPNRPDEDLLKSLMGNDFEYVTHLGDEGDYVIIDPHFYPSTSRNRFLKLVDHLRTADHFDLCFLGELSPAKKNQLEDLSILDQQFNEGGKEITVVLKNHGSKLMSTCMFWRKRRLVTEDQRLGIIHPPVFTHKSVNGLVKAISQLTEDSTKPLTEEVSTLVEKLTEIGIGPSDESTKETFKRLITEAAESISSDKLSDKSKDRTKSSDQSKSQRSIAKYREDSDSKVGGAAFAFIVVVIIIVAAAVIMSQRRNRIQ